ncbi:MAG: GNAT family N-acetyltransferase [Pseudomonadota bacterium]
MVRLEKIQEPLFAKLYDAFLWDDDPLSGEAEWRDVFDYQWETEEGHCGYALLDGETLVGMIGMVFSDRVIEGVTHKFCNLHTWWVREDYRGHSVSMLRPIVQLKGYNITHFTPCDRVRAVTEKLGFKQLNSQLRILLPLGKPKTEPVACTINDDVESFIDHLDPSDRKIALDHKPYRSGHLLVNNSNAQCYVLYTEVIRHRLPYIHIHYASDYNVFVKYEPQIRTHLLQDSKAKFVAIDERRVGNHKFPRSFRFWAPAHAMFKSNGVDASQVDHLYSDVVFLSLTTLPHMSHELKQMGRKLVPFLKPQA